MKAPAIPLSRPSLTDWSVVTLLTALLALFAASFAAAAPPGDARNPRTETLPSQPLQPPVDNSLLRAPDNAAERRGRRVTPPPKPEGRIQVVPGVSFLHKEGSTSIVREARQRRPGTEPRMPDGGPIIAPDPRPGIEPRDPAGLLTR